MSSLKQCFQVSDIKKVVRINCSTWSTTEQKLALSGEFLYCRFLALRSKESIHGFIPWSIDIDQNSSTFHVWSSKNTTLSFPIKMFDLTKKFIGTFLLIANSWCLQLVLYQTPGSTVSSLSFNILPMRKNLQTLWQFYQLAW